MPVTAEAGLAGAMRPGGACGAAPSSRGEDDGGEGRHLAQWGSASGPEPLGAAWPTRAQACLMP